MTKEYAKELLKDYPKLKDNEIINIILTVGVWNKKTEDSITVETFSIKELKRIANE